MSRENLQLKPFVKWAGGKGQLLHDIRKKYPVGLGYSITKYCEPFVGGGAVLFDILSNYKIRDVLINGINPELVNTYIQIKVSPKYLIEKLILIQDYYWSLNLEERKHYYYEKRELFNFLKINGGDTDNIEKAALFIFLIG